MNKNTHHNIEYQTNGPFGSGRIITQPTGVRQVEILWRGKPPLFLPSSRIDLQSAKASSLKDALNKACHNLGYLPTFNYKELKGPKALVCSFTRPDNNTGYACISKQGQKSIRFSLERIDLEAMHCSCPQEALQKVAFVTGTIKLHSNPLNKID
jgi:hypothetical protein